MVNSGNYNNPSMLEGDVALILINANKRLAVCWVQQEPGDVPGVSQRLPQVVLLRGRLLTQETDTLGREQRGDDGLGDGVRAVRAHLAKRGQQS